MIIDLSQFIAQGQPLWQELEQYLQRFEDEPRLQLDLPQLKRFHYLYERTAADLVKIGTFSAEPRTREYLESLIARAYGQIHDNQRLRWHRGALRAGFNRFPQTVRRHHRALWLATGIMLAGVVFGVLSLLLDPEAKAVIMPFSYLQQDPAQRVAKAEAQHGKRLRGHKTTFSAYLMTHNTRVSIFVLAGGMTYGSLTAILDFYNGVTLGGVIADYLRAGEGVFLTGWLLPHGSVEIPAILIACQAGLILAGALLGHSRKRQRLSQRLRAVRGDLVTLITGVACMLIWSGLIEAFFSQYHQPVLPYSVKILVGSVQLLLLVMFLWFGGRRAPEPTASARIS